jgi:hypothetical protein
VISSVVHHNLTHKFAEPNCRLDRPVNGADMIQQSLEFPVTFESAQQKRRPHTRITPDGLDSRPATRHSRNAPPLPCRRKHLNELHYTVVHRYEQVDVMAVEPVSGRVVIPFVEREPGDSYGRSCPSYSLNPFADQRRLAKPGRAEMRVSLRWRPAFSRSIRRGRGTSSGRMGGI